MTFLVVGDSVREGWVYLKCFGRVFDAARLSSWFSPPYHYIATIVEMDDVPCHIHNVGQLTNETRLIEIGRSDIGCMSCLKIALVLWLWDHLNLAPKDPGEPVRGNIFFGSHPQTYCWRKISCTWYLLNMLRLRCHWQCFWCRHMRAKPKCRRLGCETGRRYFRVLFGPSIHSLIFSKIIILAIWDLSYC